MLQGFAMALQDFFFYFWVVYGSVDQLDRYVVQLMNVG